MGGADLATALRQYEQGRITVSELLGRIARLAADRPVAEMATTLPEWLLDQLREVSTTPPPSPDRAPRTLHLGSWVGSHDHEAWEHRERRLWFDGAWNWHHYFRTEA
jgi:hypothetical protein